jgi:hypothetical protein
VVGLRLIGNPHSPIQSICYLGPHRHHPSPLTPSPEFPYLHPSFRFFYHLPNYLFPLFMPYLSCQFLISVSLNCLPEFLLISWILIFGRGRPLLHTFSSSHLLSQKLSSPPSLAKEECNEDKKYPKGQQPGHPTPSFVSFGRLLYFHLILTYRSSGGRAP